jgi:hypothetical protein
MREKGRIFATFATRTGQEKSERGNNLLPIRSFSPEPTLVVRFHGECFAITNRTLRESQLDFRLPMMFRDPASLSLRQFFPGASIRSRDARTGSFSRRQLSTNTQHNPSRTSVVMEGNGSIEVLWALRPSILSGRKFEDRIASGSGSELSGIASRFRPLARLPLTRVRKLNYGSAQQPQRPSAPGFLRNHRILRFAFGGKSDSYTSAFTQTVLRSATEYNTSPALTYCPCVTFRSTTVPDVLE